MALSPGRTWLIASLIILLLTAPFRMVRSQSSMVRFVDVTKNSGITFSHVSAPEKKYIVDP